MIFLLKITSVSGLNQVVFKEYANAPALRKFTSLFPGLGYAAGYKVCKFSISLYPTRRISCTNIHF